MPTTTATLVATGHAHDVSLDDAFDFLNTDDTDNGFPAEKLPTLDSALDWFVDRGVIHDEGADRLRGQAAQDPAFGQRELDRVHAVRSALREVAQAVVDERKPTPGALATVNRTLHARQVIELVPSDDACIAVDHRHVGDPIDDALARLADPIVLALTSGHAERIRQCQSDTCFWFFYDTSKTHRRRWCDMATCGNRAKAARHRARSKAGDTMTIEMLDEVAPPI
jgi:predicted RNA-binding Zn ribbon-like protein